MEFLARGHQIIISIRMKRKLMQRSSRSHESIPSKWTTRRSWWVCFCPWWLTKTRRRWGNPISFKIGDYQTRWTIPWSWCRLTLLKRVIPTSRNAVRCCQKTSFCAIKLIPTTLSASLMDHSLTQRTSENNLQTRKTSLCTFSSLEMVSERVWSCLSAPSSWTVSHVVAQLQIKRGSTSTKEST